MKRKTIGTLCIALLTVIGVSWFARRRKQARVPQGPVVQKHKTYTTQTPNKTTIRHVINTTGSLRIKDSSKVGSLVSGIVKTIDVKENERVRKGQLLATLDNGKGDTVIRRARGDLISAQASFDYYRKVYEREKILFDAGHIAEQDFEKHELNMLTTKGVLMTARAALEAAEIEYKNTYIRAPEDGIVIAIGIKKGFKVTTDLNATVLFTIARDITRMEAELEIDEGDIAHVHAGQKVKFTVDSHPGKVFKGVIADISFSPTSGNGGLYYEALLDVTNDKLLLRPGMTVHAIIKVAKAKGALGVASQAFYFDDKTIEYLAERLGYDYKPLPRKEKKRCLNCDDKEIKFAWVVKDKCLIERPVTIGARDAQYVEAQDGIEENDAYLTDIEEIDRMDAYYKKMFSGAL